jgi:hypothetical protein
MTGTVVRVSSWLLLVPRLSYRLQAEIWIRPAREAIASTCKYYILYLLILITGLVVVTEHNVWPLDWNVAVTFLSWP